MNNFMPVNLKFLEEKFTKTDTKNENPRVPYPVQSVL